MISEVAIPVPTQAAMKVTQVAIIPTEASKDAERPALTPELLAASGARYSRNNEGLEAILSKIDPKNLDKSVESIFKMVDYGHQSIADMVPVAIFMDNISLWLAYYLWTLCPTAGGQESSTRYIKLSKEGLVQPSSLGGSVTDTTKWYQLMDGCFSAYQSALQIFDDLFEADPALAKIPSNLLAEKSDKANKQTARMQRNYSFDRARYFLPTAALTNVMMIMSARGWVQLCQQLLSHNLPEALQLGELIKEELRLAAPRMVRHAELKETTKRGQEEQFQNLVARARAEGPEFLARFRQQPDHPPTARLQVTLPESLNKGAFVQALRNHENRYAWIGEDLARTAVRFGWDAMALGEIRDLNRHRTGTKYCPLLPRGFYFAYDQIPDKYEEAKSKLLNLSKVGVEANEKAWQLLAEGNPNYVYFTLLGTQFQFEHLTTADKFIYEAELRTGTGAHYRYALHLRDALSLWYKEFPETKGLIQEGTAEPE